MDPLMKCILSSQFLLNISLSRTGTVPRCKFIRSLVGVRKGTYFNMIPPVVAAEKRAKQFQKSINSTPQVTMFKRISWD